MLQMYCLKRPFLDVNKKVYIDLTFEMITHNTKELFAVA